eukprot:9503974-Pyramimonas_sp.AAC.3
MHSTPQRPFSSTLLTLLVYSPLLITLVNKKTAPTAPWHQCTSGAFSPPARAPAAGSRVG